MSNLTNGLILVLCISAMLILGGTTMNMISNSDTHYISCQGTMFNNCTGTDTGNPLSQLPSVNNNPVDPTGITGEEGIFASIGSWLADFTGISYVYNILSAPITFLKAIHVPEVFANILGGIWYALLLFLLVSWWKGQDS
jgi:hypothetical protein